ncbi:GNAT family N-acetyltransferase [Pelagibacterium sp.]|uniref:GNAT family N-acetyltransferase n=1 Tax=Pelagibacterium sp. TaxID=1967288 RepID=UPI003BABAB33
MPAQAALPASADLSPLTPDDLDAAYALTRSLKWPHRREDWQVALAMGQGLALRLDGQLAGTILWWFQGAGHATIGLVIVDDAHRGRGLGRLLMEQGLAACAGRQILLHATLAGAPLYLKLGFVPAGHIAQHQGLPLVTALDMDDGNVALAGPEDMDAIFGLDRAASGLDRGDLLAALFSSGRVFTGRADGEVQSYALARPFGRGYLIGPVVAQTPALARPIIAAACTMLEGQFVRIDVLEDPQLQDWLQSIGLVGVDRVAAMALGGAPARAGRPRLVALASQALG